MSFQVRNVFLTTHRFQSRTWNEILGAQRYEISVMDTFFRSDDPAEQVKESKLWYIAGTYVRRFDKHIPVVAVPNTRVLAVNTPLEIIDIVPTKNAKQGIYQCVSAYAQKIAKEEKLKFIDLTRSKTRCATAAHQESADS